MYIYFGTYNSYYDSENLTYPVQKYFDERYVYKVSDHPWVVVGIDQTDIVYRTGEVQSIYETGSVASTSGYSPSNDPQTLAIFEFFLSPKYFKIIQKEEYQPIITSKRNIASSKVNNSTLLLDTSSSTSSNQNISDRNEFYAFFVIAQIGGLYSFLRFIFGALVSLFSEKWYLMQILNLLRTKIRTRQDMERYMRKPRSRKRRVVPTNYEEEKNVNEHPSETTNFKSLANF